MTRNNPVDPPGNGLRHPVVICMFALWVLNDHFLKAAFGNAITGKLSDVAGLIVFPVFLVAIAEWIGFWTHKPAPCSRAILMVSLVGTGLFFFMLNLSTAFSDGVSLLLGGVQWPFRTGWAWLSGDRIPELTSVHSTPDWTDALTLPALWVPWRLERSRLMRKTNALS